MSDKTTLLGECESEFEGLKRALRGLKTTWKLVDLNGRHHYQAHAQDIAGWRKSRGI